MTASLQSIKGVQKPQVSHPKGQAVLVLEEMSTPLSSFLAQLQKASRFKATLRIQLKDGNKAQYKQATEALQAVKGVKEAKATKKGILVKLNPDSKVKYQDLVLALHKSELKVMDPVRKAAIPVPSVKKVQ